MHHKISIKRNCAKGDSDMALKEPESMDEVFYFTRRVLENDGWIRAWVYRPEAPSGKGRLRKPLNPRSGKPDKKSEFYEDPGDGKLLPCAEVDPTLKMEIKYKSPHTGNEGEATTEYKLRTFQGVKAYVFEDDAGNKIGITKKMKETKSKKKKK